MRYLALALAALTSAFASCNFAFAETLQIGIEHSDYLAPVSQIDNIAPQMTNRNPTMLPSNASRYQAGVSYEQASRPPQKMVEWFQIPKWMAGTWSKQGDTTISATDLRSGYTQQMNQWTDNRMSVAFGHQQDRSGSIWQANILAETDSISGSKQVKFLLCRVSARALLQTNSLPGHTMLSLRLCPAARSVISFSRSRSTLTQCCLMES
ncbi:MAG: hypothetical protein IPJ49_02850 [Candidatus Obscuribacter sp.]|nr:hypothetical protein [Candidatus Obscuribacter sp.]